MNLTGQLFTPTPPTSNIGRFSVSPEQLPYISEHTTFLFAELDAHNSQISRDRNRYRNILAFGDERPEGSYAISDRVYNTCGRRSTRGRYFETPATLVR